MAEVVRAHGVRTFVLGSALPAVLRVGTAQLAAADADLLLLAPDAAEQRSLEWQSGAVAAAADAAPGTLVYLLASPGARRRIGRALGAAGWSVAGAWIHLPDQARSALLVPASGAGVRYAMKALPTRRRIERRLARGAVAIPGADRLLPLLAAPIGIVLGRRGGADPFSWLGHRPAAAAGGIAVVPGWRAGSGRITLIALHADGEPAWVAKVALTDGAAAALEREVARLRDLGSSAAAAGAMVPAVLATPGAAAPGTAVPECLFQSAVPGASFAALLARRELDAARALERVGRWLGAWHDRSVQQCPAHALVARDLLSPLGELRDGLGADGASYDELIRARIAALPRTIPAVAQHGDLTMTNLLDAGDWLGVVDWEAATGDGLPLADFAYAAVDAVLRGGGVADRAAAYDACFHPGGRMYAAVERWITGTAAALELSPPLIRLCLDACWVSHAANERARSAPGDARPFLELLRRHVARELA